MRLQVGPEPTDMKTAMLSVSTPEQKTFDRGEPFASSKREWKIMKNYLDVYI